MPTIKHIHATPYNVPLKGTLKWGKAHELKHLEHVLVRVELSSGAVGFAEVTPRPTIYGETQTSVLHMIEEHFAPVLLGKSISSFDNVAHLSSQLGLIKANNTAKGGVDMALHQALTIHHGQSLSSYLGATQEKVLVSYIVSTGTTEAVIADVQTAYDQGVRVFKVKIGKDIPQETETIQQLTTQLKDALFYVDANQTLADNTGADVLNDLYAMGVIHCEEALPVYDIQSRHVLRQQTKMPIIADDSAFTLEDLQRELTFDTFDILNIKTPRTGFSQSKAMWELCQHHHKQIMIGSQASSLLGCLYAAIFSSLPYINCANECSFFLKTDVDISDAPVIVDGYMTLNDIETSLQRILDLLDK